ncbi:P-loop containing nucleoside triphosphate hydrolase protein [Mycena haematopus]|nr:P-loop containing nucleoside triphosphate hydrolase protein [Mycena haematopus]
MSAGMSAAGPSRRNPPKKSRKAAPPPRPAKAKKLSEKQQKETLEREVQAYIAPEGLKTFAELPISEPTKRGLKKAFFVNMTDIQTQSLPVSLKGKDVLGAARTGSGKTLSFLVPVLEILYRRKWGPTDGLGALVISPTRELAIQIFEVLRSIGGLHTFSAGLVIGGKNLKDERDRLSKMNILVATPGRLLQHMDQTVGFEADNLQVLVLDEADRILDMGFSRTLSALLSHLPKSRQTLLFSATQTDSVNDLARLSLKDPVHIGIGDTGSSTLSAMPPNLEHHYLSCTLDQKLSILWGFIKTHLQSKTLVFLSSCKQVRFVFETFCKMHPGVPLLHLHGKLRQTARLAMYTKFTQAAHAVLFATDVAARGLDFPRVDWVVQVDAPEDAETYVHRVGRTARYESKGKALLFVLPSEEEGMTAALKRKGIEVQRIKAKMNKVQPIENQLQNLCFQDPEIKYLGQRAFVSYLRSIHLHKDKSIFKLAELPAQRFAESLGLPGAPKIKFLTKEMAKQKKNMSRAVAAAQAEVRKEKADDDAEVGSEEEEDSGDEGDVHDSSDEEGGEEEEESTKPKAVRTKYDRIFERKNQTVLSAHYSKLIEGNQEDADDDDEFITLKRADHDLDGPAVDEAAEMSKRKQRMMSSKAKRALLTGGLGRKLIFDDEGKPHELYEMEDADAWINDKGGIRGVEEEGRRFAEGEKGKMQEANVRDKEEAKEKKREKKRKRKEREKAEAGVAGGGAMVLGPDEDADDDGYVEPEFDLPPSDSDDDRDTWAPPPPTKRSKTAHVHAEPALRAVEDDEELALRLLRRRP